MTHDELLYMTDLRILASPRLKALHEVVKLHKPHDITLPDGDYGIDCEICHGYEYPCPTIQAIEKELG